MYGIFFALRCAQGGEIRGAGHVPASFPTVVSGSLMSTSPSPHLKSPQLSRTTDRVVCCEFPIVFFPLPSMPSCRVYDLRFLSAFNFFLFFQDFLKFFRKNSKIKNMKSAETSKNAIKNEDFLSAREARRENFWVFAQEITLKFSENCLLTLVRRSCQK